MTRILEKKAASFFSRCARTFIIFFTRPPPAKVWGECALRRTEEGGSWNSLGLVEPLIVVDLVESAKKMERNVFYLFSLSLFYTTKLHCVSLLPSPILPPPIPYHPTAEEEEVGETELFESLLEAPRAREGGKGPTGENLWLPPAVKEGKGRIFLGHPPPDS